MSVMVRRIAIRHIALVALLSGVLLITPLVIHAQSSSTSSDLRAAVQSLILTDPRSASLPPAQLDAMIDVLTKQAQAQGLTARDILYRPGQSGISANNASQAQTCSSIFCSVSDVFGFSGPAAAVFFLVLLLSGALILIIGRKLLHHHAAEAAVQATPTP